ncbi:beta strand repeat-containing protein [Novosphingobium huizhouense]|uniref:beta strand repeat-containing protein n=1 Tax=Novosphingobium huizhouense TaxID=2866625 RepID=UPI001CD8B24B|nr:hypothetical protein [Novosphingobium huizhouense]
MTNINKMKFALLGATALLASTAAQAQVADTWTIDNAAAPLSVTSQNGSADSTANVIMNSATATDGTAGAIITDGQKNSISATALGASAGASFTVTSSTDSSLTAQIVGNGDNTQVSANSFGNVQNFGEISDASIANGTSNSISRVALGASGSVNASVTVLGGEQVSNYTIGGVDIKAQNNLILNTDGDTAVGLVSNSTNISTADMGGNSNSVSAAAIGSSASLGASTMILDGSETATFNFGVNSDGLDPTGNAAAGLTVFSGNQSNVIVAGPTADFSDLTDPTALAPASLSANMIDGTNSNSASSSAIGSSAGVSYSTTVYGGDVSNVANFNTVVGDDGAFTSSDTFTITSLNGADLTDPTGATPITVDSVADGLMPAVINNTDIAAAQIGADGANNSISVAGIGSSASMSFSVNDYSGGGSSIANTINSAAPAILSVNYANVNVGSTLTAPQIDGGVSNSVSAAAIGASASQAFSLFTK